MMVAERQKFAQLQEQQQRTRDWYLRTLVRVSLISIIRDQQTGIPELDTKCQLVLSEITIRDWVIFTLISIIRGQEFGWFSEISKEELLNQGLDVLCTEHYYQRFAKKTQRLVSVSVHHQ